MNAVTALVGLTAAALLVMNLVQFLGARIRNRQLLEVTQSLQRIIGEQTAERIRIVTGDHALRKLLIEINRVLDGLQQSQVHYQQKELAIRKMLANISHDLKTPLTVVLGYVETLQHEQLRRDQSNVEPRLSKIRDKTTELLDLIHQFFDLARLEAGDQELDMQKIQLNEICKERLLSFYDLIQSEQLQVDLDISDQPLYVLADRNSLERILDNLIANAIRYGKDGKLVGLRLYDEANNVHVEVWDKGSGISERDKDKVFERSYTLDDSRNKQYPGSGLGLTICKRLMEQMGGEISLASQPYVRTSFTLTFRLLKEVRIS